MIKQVTYYLLLKLENICSIFYTRKHYITISYENKYLLQKVYDAKNNRINKSTKFVHKNLRLF